MTLKELAYIVAVAEELHFHRAAERCHVTQSTLSNQLKKCEDYLGVTIFRRNRHQVELTPEGEKIQLFPRGLFQGLFSGSTQIPSLQE